MLDPTLPFSSMSYSNVLYNSLQNRLHVPLQIPCESPPIRQLLPPLHWSSSSQGYQLSIFSHSKSILRIKLSQPVSSTAQSWPHALRDCSSLGLTITTLAFLHSHWLVLSCFLSRRPSQTSRLLRTFNSGLGFLLLPREHFQFHGFTCHLYPGKSQFLSPIMNSFLSSRLPHSLGCLAEYQRWHE